MTEFVEVKTADLVGAALDWAVAKADGRDPKVYFTGIHEHTFVYIGDCGTCKFNPTVSWIWLGALIKRYRIEVRPLYIGDWEAQVMADDEPATPEAEGSSPELAICRAIVEEKLGETVSVPKELLS
ncbi:hypothetical protein AL064_18890 [Pseudomonas syringae pv. syringae]|uniref:phage protein NinX family protein n=1 Tax=Pseudomonas syringae TaxID=317 RepID=UPI0007602558|nr:phage protein NinX family protein [Pseudomonas syringae]KWS07481.1 hypothetical protein AL064_18890 [Pseudomonas syringae pv. syringae]